MPLVNNPNNPLLKNVTVTTIPAPSTSKPPAQPQPAPQPAQTFTPQQILAQNKVFAEAYKSGQITEAEYKQALTVQSVNLAKALAPTLPPAPLPVMEAPEGFEVVSVKQQAFTSNPAAPLPVNFWGPTPPPQQTLVVTEATVAPKVEEVWATKSLFGPQFTRAPTEQEKADLQQRYLKGESITESAEQRALLGFSLATMAAPIAASPIIAASAGTALGVGEAVKYGTTGKHLTVPEAIGAAGIGVMVGGGITLGIKAVKAYATHRLTESYDAAVKAGHLWEPSVNELRLMKYTGTQAKELATGIVDAPLPIQRVGQNLLVNYDLDSSFMDMIAPRQSLLTRSDVPSGLVSSARGLPSYLGGMSMVPAVEIFHYPQKPSAEVGVAGPATKSFGIDGDVVQVWAQQPSKALYQTMPANYLQGFVKQTQVQTRIGGGGMAPLWGSVGSVAKQVTEQVQTQPSKPDTGTAILEHVTKPTSIVESRQTQNPFLQFSGVPFYPSRRREREDVIVTYIVYPSSGLSHPERSLLPQTETEAFVSPAEIPSGIIEPRIVDTLKPDRTLDRIIVPRRDPLPTTIPSEVVVPKTDPVQPVIPSVIPDQIVVPVPDTKVVPDQVVIPKTDTIQDQVLDEVQKQTQTTRSENPFLDDWFLHGSARGRTRPFDPWRRYKREYPIISAKEMMKQQTEVRRELRKWGIS